ncbi:UNVERIFIED_CONTAM: hypothetical protein Slati_4396700 [Sesamum latifolium]|uniref:Neurochondrin n=1 Tax=Sesamum latifolium TaxID=2727402 RepID=A0AAW2SQC2_9LAMI
MDHQTQPSSSSSSSPPSLQDLLKLLRGKTDSQRLAGLLLVTQYCDKNDQHTLLTVYHAIGSTFLHRLLLTGMPTHTAAAPLNPNREAYLRLSLTLLATFATLPHIAATHDMLAKLPLVLEVTSSEFGSSLSDECFEFLFLVCTAHDDGVTTFYESGGMNVLGSQMPTLPDAPAEKLQALLLAECVISIVGEEWLIGPTTLHNTHSSFPADRPFYSISFLLPMMCQITMKDDGCKLFASAGGFRAVVGCLVSLIDSSRSRIEHNSTIFLACDTILNFLLKREQVWFSLDNISTVKLLQALAHWTEDTQDQFVIMMASSICSVILDSTSEESLLCHPEFNTKDLIALAKLVKRSLETCCQVIPRGASYLSEIFFASVL